MPKTLWDWIAYTGIWLAAIFEGIWFYSDAVPTVSVHAAPLFTEPLWALLPLALLLLSGGITVYRVFTGHIPLQIEVPSAPGRASWPQIKWAAIIPTALIAAALGSGATYLVTASGAPSPSAALHKKQYSVAVTAPPKARYAPVLRGAITLAYVQAVLHDYPADRAAAILAKYLGRPIIASGFIKDSDSQNGGSTWVYYLTDKTVAPVIYLVFNADKNPGLQYFPDGDFIEGVCQIERLDASGVGLNGCVIMKDGIVTGTP